MEIQKAFEFATNQLGTLSMPKQNHIFVEQILKETRNMILRAHEEEARKTLTPSEKTGLVQETIKALEEEKELKAAKVREALTAQK